MKNNTTVRRWSAATAVIAIGTGALVAGLVGASGASALIPAPYTDYNNITITPSSSTYDDGDLVDLAGSGIAVDDTYNLTLCRYQTIHTTVVPANPPVPAIQAWIPACSATITTVTVSGGAFTASNIPIDYDPVNVHAGVGPEQPSTLRLDVNLGEFVLVPTHGSGGALSVGDTAEFYVTP